MTKKNSQRAEIIQYFYDQVSEKDWLEGVDIYQDGKVGEITFNHNLIVSKIKSGITGSSEARLKIHPNGKVIQWIECSCKKNRSYSIYCEHIAALIIHINHEHPKIIESLDGKMPLTHSPPRLTRKIKQTQLSSIRYENNESGHKIKNASQALINHLQGSIHGVSLPSKGPKIRIQLEIKPGHITNYDLNIDDSVKFLETNTNIGTFKNEVKILKLLEESAFLGTHIYFIDAEKIVAERVISLRVDSNFKMNSPTHKSISVKDSTKVSTTFEQEKATYLFLPIKNFSKYIGEKYVFIPSLGYAKLSNDFKNSQWSELPLTRTFKDDEAAKLVQDNFSSYLNTAPIWLDEPLEHVKVNSLPVLSQINIHNENDGWFSLSPLYGEGKQSISMSEIMLVAKRKNRKFIKSENRWFQIPDYIRQNDWQLDEEQNNIKVDTLGLLRLKAALGDFDKFAGSKNILEKIRNRIEFDPNIPEPDISKSNLNLRSYQNDGLKWFWWLYKNNIHGLLADDMGLGKTHQAMGVMTAIQAENEKKDPKKRSYFLVICPTTVLDHWEDKINDFAPNLKPLKYHGRLRTKDFKSLGHEYHTLITSYGILLRDIKKLSEHFWDSIILDEAHYVKNNNTSTYRAACKLKSKIRLCLTGTPMENHLGELKNLYDFLVPGYLGSDDYFRKNYINPIQNKDLNAEIGLQKLIHPLKLRRTKEQVLSDLPDKIEDLRHCQLSNEQIKLYRDILSLKGSPIISQLKDGKKPVPYLHVFAVLQMLKKVCDHPALFSENLDYKKHESGKFEALKEIIFEALDSGNKIVIFTQYVKMVQIIETYCKDQQIKVVSMTGKSRNRGAIIEKFQKDEDIKIFIGSLMAGGIGIDLTAASVVIHYDRWWNPSKENQATDRVHRIGQKKFVQVIKLISRGTLEEKISDMISKKNEVFNKFLEKDEEVFKSMTRQDLIELLK